jgi:hypothetical protein
MARQQNDPIRKPIERSPKAATTRPTSLQGTRSILCQSYRSGEGRLPPPLGVVCANREDTCRQRMLLASSVKPRAGRSVCPPGSNENGITVWIETRRCSDPQECTYYGRGEKDPRLIRPAGARRQLCGTNTSPCTGHERRHVRIPSNFFLVFFSAV